MAYPTIPDAIPIDGKIIVARRLRLRDNPNRVHINPIPAVTKKNNPNADNT
jgi:hypothetical protein